MTDSSGGTVLRSHLHIPLPSALIPSSTFPSLSFPPLLSLPSHSLLSLPSPLILSHFLLSLPSPLILSSPFPPLSFSPLPSPPHTYKLVDRHGRLWWKFRHCLLKIGILLALLNVVQLAVDGGLECRERGGGGRRRGQEGRSHERNSAGGG